MSLWAEIRQRRITQFVLAYLAGGYLTLTVIDQVVDREVLPLVVYEVALTLYLIGILAALIVGWYHGEKGEQKAPLVEIVMLSLIGLSALGASGMVIRRTMREATIDDALNPEALRQIAVLYLQDVSADGSLQVVADGVTESLIEELSQVDGLEVRSRNGAREARSLGRVSPDSVARVLEVGALVDGTIDSDGDDLNVRLRLLEGESGTVLFAESYAWPADSVATIGTSLASAMSIALRERIGDEIRLRQGQRDAPNSAAWLQVARAERSIQRAKEALQSGDPDATRDAYDAADAELEAARSSAPEWTRPIVLEAEVDYQRYVFAHDAESLVATLQAAIDHADEALSLDPLDAGALEWRGTTRYRRWLMDIDDGPTRDALFRDARQDLERAKSLDRDRASVNSTLSHLYGVIGDWTNSVITAREAYQQDAFLDVADGILWRLLTGYYDLGEHDNAESACLEGYDRFPHNYRFVQCQILVMTMPAAQPDVPHAWALHDELVPLLTERPDFFEAQSRVMIASIIGRAGLADSAQATFASARVTPDVDPDRELLSFEAAMRSVMGDVDGSIATLREYIVANPDHPPGQHWWWRNVESNPEFQAFRAAGH